jgi:hypothetical protein
LATVFCLSLATVAILARVFGGIVNQPAEEHEPIAEAIARAEPGLVSDNP